MCLGSSCHLHPPRSALRGPGVRVGRTWQNRVDELYK